MSHKLFVKNPKWPTVDILIEVQSFHRLSNSFSLLFICCVALCFHDFMFSKRSASQFYLYFCDLLKARGKSTLKTVNYSRR